MFCHKYENQTKNSTSITSVAIVGAPIYASRSTQKQANDKNLAKVEMIQVDDKDVETSKDAKKVKVKRLPKRKK